MRHAALFAAVLLGILGLNAALDAAGVALPWWGSALAAGAVAGLAALLLEKVFGKR